MQPHDITPVTPDQPNNRRHDDIILVTHNLLRRIDNSTRFIAWIVGIWVVLSVIGGIIVAVQLAKVGSTFDPGNCLSVGGNDPSC